MTLKHLIGGVSPGVDDLEQGGDDSELGILIQRVRSKEKAKAQHHWSLLRNCIRNTIQALTVADLKDIVLRHGIHHERKLNHSNKIEQVVFIDTRKEYLTSDGKQFRVFLEDGRKKSVITTQEPMDRVVYSSETDQFVGWVHEQDILYLLDPNFEIISQARTPGGIFLSTINKNTAEIITIGPNYFQCWGIRYGARHLIPRLTVSTDFGEDEMFSMLALEDTASHAQRIFFAYNKGVVVYNVFYGSFLDHKKHLHVRNITAMMFFNPLKQLVTGACDGTIKIWDSTWHVKMVFVGHNGIVNALSLYPHGPAVMSASVDGTIRVWNMETCDVVDSVSITEPVEGLGTVINYDFFYTHSGTTVDLWRIQHLYQVHTSIGYRVNSIKMTTHPLRPVRAMLMCRDSSIRIVSPPNGNVITTLMLDPANTGGLVDAAYAVAENVLFTVLGNGDIVKSSTETNPCTIIATWKTSDPKELCSCLLVYEYVVDGLAEKGVWSVTKRGVATKSINYMEKPRSQPARNRTLLLGGRKDGYICVFNWDTGEVEFKVEAHGTKGVLSMMANSKFDQLISAGMDNVIKVWRLYPFASEALAPLMSFYCAHTPAYMSACKTILSVAFEDPTTATFSTVVYHLRSKSRYDHEPQDDHVDMITGMSSCPRMKLFATSSLDGTIRIWNETNNLVRLLKLDTTPYSIGFCSQKGDLLLGTGDHLFRIPYSCYMPKAFTFKMMSMTFLNEKSEDPLPYDELLLKKMSKHDIKRLKKSHSSFKFSSFMDILTEEEQLEVMREQMIKDEAFGILDAREEDIKQIRDGEIKAKHHPQSTEETKSEAFFNYMKLFYDKPRIQLPVEDEFPEDTLKQILSPRELVVTEEPYKPGQLEQGFFPRVPTSHGRLTAREQETTSETDTKPLVPGYPTCYSGFIPNSILVKLLFPPEKRPSEKVSKKYVAPTLSLSQLEQIDTGPGERMASRLRRSVTFATRESTDITQRVMAFNWDDDEKDEDEIFDEEDVDDVKADDEEEEYTKTPTPIPSPVSMNDSLLLSPAVTPARSLASTPEMKISLPSTPTSKKPSSLMSKFVELMEKTPPLPTDDEEMNEWESESPIEPSGISPTTSTKDAQRQQRKPLKQVKKLEPIKKSVPRRVPTPRSPTPSPVPCTPLPEFITQFQDSDWFQKYFPDSHSIQKPWAVDTFALEISSVLPAAMMRFKTGVTESLLQLFKEEGFTSDTKWAVCKTLFGALGNANKPPTCSVPLDKRFIMSALDLLNELSVRNKEFVIQLMMLFLDGDPDVRAAVLDVLVQSGMIDPHKQFSKELDSWDIWSIDGPDKMSELYKMCDQWLNRWMSSYKLHMKDTVEQLQKGKNVHGRITRSQLQQKRSTSQKNLADDQTSDGADFISTATSTHSGRSMTVTMDNLPDDSVMDGVTHIDCINYFCEMMVEKEIEMVKRRKSTKPKAPSAEKVELTKNTVLVLPKLPHKTALVRLGEMHTSVCRPERETNLSIDYTSVPGVNSRTRQIPGELYGFTTYINLPMKTLYMNPFPSDIDKYDKRFQEPILITLRSSQKFFVPARSHVPLPPCS